MDLLNNLNYITFGAQHHFHKSTSANNMSKWTPISLEELFLHIQRTESSLKGDLLHFWELIKTYPAKWAEPEHGTEGGGFWVVGICGSTVIWYNDIEEGFNISDYHRYGHIADYYCNQDELSLAIQRLYNLIRTGGKLGGHRY